MRETKEQKKKRIAKIIILLSKNHGNTMLARLSHMGAYKSLISTILSARARDETTEVLAKELFRKYRTMKSLADAPLPQLEKDIKKSGFYKQKARRIKEVSQIILTKHRGKVPETMEELTALPGVGRKTAGCVLVYAFGKQAIPVDTHVHRISNRLGLVETKAPEKTEQELMKLVPKNRWHLVNDLLVNHGKTICNPITPSCSRCEISKLCPRKKVTRWK
ncbi:endonuclease III [Candidatus Woesearchaeota archaeon]|nr:endonuclease III [Candidatus Woesearchaeota archaeon]